MIVEFAGLPRSGKTSAIGIARDYYLRSGRNVRMAGEAVRACPFRNDHRLEIACWAANRALNSLLAAKLGLSPETLTLQDRGMLDALAFLRLLYVERFIDRDTLTDFMGYFASPRWTQLVDLVVLFEVSPEVVIERDLAAKLSAGEGLITNITTLRNLAASYEFIIERYGDRFPRIRRLPTMHVERMQIARKVIRFIEEAILL